jgi:hypothetical protein
MLSWWHISRSITIKKVEILQLGTSFLNSERLASSQEVLEKSLNKVLETLDKSQKFHSVPLGMQKSELHEWS